MPELQVQQKQIEIDDDGCLVRFHDWDENVARVLAVREGVGELTQEKMKMLMFIRDYYQRYDFFPVVRSICRNVNKQKDCVHEEFINPLIAWKIAGLPHPEEPVVSLLGAGQSPG